MAEVMNERVGGGEERARGSQERAGGGGTLRTLSIVNSS